MTLTFEGIEGRIDENAEIAPFTWFRVGGKADLIFRPKDAKDLGLFLSQLPSGVPVMPIGAGSNIIIRDGGMRGVVLRLGKGFGDMKRIDDHHVEIGAAVPDMNAAKFMAEQGLSGGAFLRGVPGTIGGALKMNAGAYGSEIKDIFVSAKAVTRSGKHIQLSYDDMEFRYRGTAPKDLFYTSAIFKLEQGDKETILKEMEEITQKRSETQPVKSRTGGSTFKNPEGHKAWQLVDAAGCRGMTMGGAQISELHCNFMINNDNATAYDIELLGETVRQKVYENSGILLEWEIKRLGDFSTEQVKEFKI